MPNEEEVYLVTGADTPEAARNVVSNIHSGGINPIEAGAHIASVAKKMMEQKASGTDLQLF